MKERKKKIVRVRQQQLLRQVNMSRRRYKLPRLESESTVCDPQPVSLWGDMPSDMGHLILDKLPEVVERVRFSAVSKGWNIISKEYQQLNKHCGHNSLPMLLVPSPDAPAKRVPPKLYALSCLGNHYSNLQLRLPFSRKRYCGSSHGWIATQNRNHTITLIYPFGREALTIQLPALKHGLEIYKLVLSPDSTPDNYTAVAIYQPKKELATIKSGENSWVYIPPRPETLTASLFTDIIFYQGTVYAVSKIFAVVKIDVHARPPLLKVIIPSNRRTQSFKMYLAESTSSDMFLLQRCFGDSYFLYRDLATVGFNVFKLKLHEDRGELIYQQGSKRLNGDTFFVGDNSSMAIRADGNCVANSIYFTDDLHDCGYKPSGPDVGYYSFEDDTIRHFYQTNPAHKKGVPLPIWIMPQQHTICDLQKSAPRMRERHTT